MYMLHLCLRQKPWGTIVVRTNAVIIFKPSDRWRRSDAPLLLLPLPPPLDWHHKFWDRRSKKEEPERKRLVEQLPCGSCWWRSLEFSDVIFNSLQHHRAFSSMPSYPHRWRAALLLAPSSNANTASPQRHRWITEPLPHLAIFFDSCN